MGFVVEAMGGPQAVLAHVARSSGPRVGRYRVDVAAFERVALPALDRARQRLAVVVIDELARMELASAAFVAALDDVFELPVPVLVTIHQARHPVTDRIKQRADVEVVITVTEARAAPPDGLDRHLQPACSARYATSLVRLQVVNG